MLNETEAAGAFSLHQLTMGIKMLITAFSILAATGCIETHSFKTQTVFPPTNYKAVVDEYDMFTGDMPTQHSERMHCILQDAHSLNHCDANGDHCQRGCWYKISSVLLSETADNSLGMLEIDEDFWVPEGESQWAHIELTPTSASLDQPQVYSIRMLYPESTLGSLHDQEIAVVTVN